MRITASCSLFILLLYPLTGAAQTAASHSGSSTSRTTQAKPAAKTASTSPTGPLPLTTEEQKTLYAVGLSIYRSLQPFSLTPDELKIVQRAMTDAAQDKPAVDINTYGPKIQALAESRAGQLGKQNAANGQAFVDKTAAEPGYTKLPSGMLIKVITPGDGPSPKATDTVRVNYRGTFIDGKMFDSSNGTPVEFQLDHVIPCWTEGVQQMKAGEKAQLICPSNVAYGERPNRGIPPNSTLVFEVDLVGITPAADSATPSTPPTPPAPGTPPQ